MSRRRSSENKGPAAEDTTPAGSEGWDGAEGRDSSPEPRHEDIARRAHELYLARCGHQPGNDLEDWLRAEAELRSEGIRK